MAHLIQLALGAFMSSLGVKGRTKSWKAHERDEQFAEKESILRKYIFQDSLKVMEIRSTPGPSLPDGGVANVALSFCI